MPPISLPLRSNVLMIVFFPTVTMIAAPARSLTPAFLTMREDNLPGRAKKAQSTSEVLESKCVATEVVVVPGPGKHRRYLPIGCNSSHYQQQAWLRLAPGQRPWCRTHTAHQSSTSYRWQPDPHGLTTSRGSPPPVLPPYAPPSGSPRSRS